MQHCKIPGRLYGYALLKCVEKALRHFTDTGTKATSRSIALHLIEDSNLEEISPLETDRLTSRVHGALKTLIEVGDVEMHKEETGYNTLRNVYTLKSPDAK